MVSQSDWLPMTIPTSGEAGMLQEPLRCSMFVGESIIAMRRERNRKETRRASLKSSPYKGFSRAAGTDQVVTEIPAFPIFPLAPDKKHSRFHEPVLVSGLSSNERGEGP